MNMYCNDVKQESLADQKIHRVEKMKSDGDLQKYVEFKLQKLNTNKSLGLSSIDESINCRMTNASTDNFKHSNKDNDN